jgi:hypothetical protein
MQTVRSGATVSLIVLDSRIAIRYFYQMTIAEVRRFSAAMFGHRYRLELIAALGMAAVGQGVCLTLLGDCCGTSASVYYPPVRALQALEMVRSTGRVRGGRQVLYARTALPAWTGLRRMVEDLAMDVDLGSAALDWPAAS